MLGGGEGWVLYTRGGEERESQNTENTSVERERERERERDRDRDDFSKLLKVINRWCYDYQGKRTPQGELNMCIIRCHAL
jgi:hypothetical protein